MNLCMVKNAKSIFIKNYAPKMFIAFKMAYFCSFTSGGNLVFLDFRHKKIYSIDHSVENVISAFVQQQRRHAKFNQMNSFDFCVKVSKRKGKFELR